MKNSWVLYLLLLSLTVNAEIVDKTVAVVGKELILKSDVDAVLTHPSSGIRSADDALKVLIDKSVITADCKQSGNFPSEAEVKQTISEIKKQNHLDDEGLIRALQQSGLDFATYQTQVGTEICRGRIVYGKIRSRVNVTDDDVKRAYEAQYGEGKGERLHLRDMRIMTPSTDPKLLAKAKQLAITIAQKLEEGQSPETVLAEAKKSGLQVVNEDLGSLTRKELNATVADAVFAKGPDKFRGPVQTDDGFHVIEIRERTEGPRTPLAEVKNDLHKALLDSETERLLKQYVEEAKSSIHIDVMGV